MQTVLQEVLMDLGIKLVNAMSTSFEVETVDWNNLRYYKQKCTDGMNEVHKPTVFDIKKDKKKTEFKELSDDQIVPHTSVKFVPSYADLCKNGKKRDLKWYNKTRGADISKIIEARVHQLAVFIASTNYRYDGDHYIEYKKKAQVYFNDTLVNIKSLSDYVDLFGLRHYAAVELRDPKRGAIDADKHIKFPWNIVVNVNQGGIETEDGIQDDVSYKRFEQVNLVNGVFLPSGGSHVNLLFNMIEDALHARIEKLLGTKVRDEKTKKPKSFPAEVLKNNLFIFNCIQIPIPQFAGQTKDSITLTKSELNNFKQVYKLSPAFIKKIWEQLEPVLQYKFLIKGGKKTKGKNYVKKYHKAHKLGLKASLIAPEGDSAAKTMNSIITNKKANLGFKTTGMYKHAGCSYECIKTNPRSNCWKTFKNQTN